LNLAILLPLVKSALICKMAGIDRVVGYARDAAASAFGQTFCLKDRGKYVPTPIVKVLTWNASYLGAGRGADFRMATFVNDLNGANAEETLAAPGGSIDRKTRALGKGRCIAQTPAAPIRGAANAGCRNIRRGHRLIEELGATGA